MDPEDPYSEFVSVVVNAYRWADQHTGAMSAHEWRIVKAVYAVLITLDPFSEGVVKREIKLEERDEG